MSVLLIILVNFAKTYGPRLVLPLAKWVWSRLQALYRKVRLMATHIPGCPSGGSKPKPPPAKPGR